jgi:hypothetical protein
MKICDILLNGKYYKWKFVSIFIIYNFIYFKCFLCIMYFGPNIFD